MNTGKTLLDLKRKSQSAEFAYEYKRSMRVERFIGILTLSIVLPTVVLVIVFSSVGATPPDASIFAIIGFASLISAFFRSKDNKTMKALNAEKAAARNEYWTALAREMHEYNIDTDKIEARNEFHDDAQEFTVLRNGVISDITVRSFENELVLMMNGEQMIKNSTVGV
jgi:hypothetical protein